MLLFLSAASERGGTGERLRVPDAWKRERRSEVAREREGRSHSKIHPASREEKAAVLMGNQVSSLHSLLQRKKKVAES